MAQNVAKISVESNVGCLPFTVEVIDESTTAPSAIINYNYDIEGTPNNFVSDTSHTYNSPGQYYIVQTVSNAVNPEDAQDSVLVTVLEPQQPEFYISNCKGTEAFLVVNDNFYEEYLIDWGDGNTDYTSPHDLNTHDYGAIGTYTVTVKGLINQGLSETEFANINCSTSQQDITLINDIVEAQINSLVVSEQNATTGSINLSYTTNAQTSYFLQMKTLSATNFTTIDTINNNNQPSSYTINQLNTEDNAFCFRLTAFDACDGSTRPSEEICSIRLIATPENDQNQLNWTTDSQNFQNYEVIKDGNPESVISQLGNSNYTDTQVICGTEYCYTIIMQETSATSTSDTICATAFSNTTPPSISNVSATVSKGQIDLQWEAPGVSVDHYIITRENTLNNNVLEDTLSNTQFTDVDVDPASIRYTYSITYQDVCGNVANSIIARPVYLDQYDNSTVYWTRYEGWETGVSEYILERYDQEGNLIDEVFAGTDTSYTQPFDQSTPQKLIYRIRAVPNDSNLDAVYSNFADIVFPSVVIFPNAFTPNGDGLNDIFNFTGHFVAEYELYIYNRWGELIFFSDNPDRGWNGLINGKKAKAGIYVYKANFKDDTGVSFVKQGEVLLIK